jgi:hypothetical protein
MSSQLSLTREQAGRPDALVKKSPKNVAQPGVDVMITIFCDFWQFSAKNWRFSHKPM